MPKESKEPPIVRAPHSVLRKAARALRPEEIQSQKIQRLISRMQEILRTAPDGIGLAAPQVGIPLRIFMVSSEAKELATNTRMDTSDTNRRGKEWEYFAFINPVLKKQSRKKLEMAEGCLSLPGKYGLVPRAEKVWLAWYDGRGRKHERGFTRFFARVIQHELDHLDGILISNRAKHLITITETLRG